MKEKRPRRKYFVDGRYQLAQVGVTILSNVAVILLMTALISWFYLLFFDGELICSHNRLFPMCLAVTTLVIILFSSFWSLRRSRIIAGMNHKLDILFSEAARGVLPEQPLTFRKGDYFGNLTGSLNGCFMWMKRQRDSRKIITDRLRDTIDKIRSGELHEKEAAGILEEIAADLNGTPDNRTSN